MLKIRISRETSKFVKKLPAKHQKQIDLKINDIRINLGSHDSKQLTGCSYLRMDVGEYQIIYEIKENILLVIVLIGKRNDRSVYGELSRKF